MDKAEQITEHMKALGFSVYECRAYLALLEEYPLNGYALSKASGIPRSRIYEVLKSLIGKQMVFEADDGKSKAYTPMDPEIFIKKLRSRYQGIFQDLTEYAGRLYREPKQDNQLVVIQGRDKSIPIPFGPYLAAAGWIALLWGEEIAAMYLGTL